DDPVTASTGTSVDLGAWIAAAADTTRLINKIDNLFFHGQMPATLHDALQQLIDGIPVSDRDARASAALYLALTSPDYQVEQ
ncbi:MAG TPA: hypothetical protein VHE37_07880, partial [Nevskiaceae bacterium]|nr:hypothetical protein [Nevskiaceae bacterium]